MKYLSKYLLLLIPFIFIACEEDSGGGNVDPEPQLTLELVESKTSQEVKVFDPNELDFIYELYADFSNTSNKAQTYVISMKFNEIVGDFGAGFCTTQYCYGATQDDFTPEEDTFTLAPGQLASEVFLPGLVSNIEHGFSLDIYPDFDGDQQRTIGSVSITMEFRNVDDADDMLSVDFDFSVALN